jgi:hypothetical protein
MHPEDEAVDERARKEDAPGTGGKPAAAAGDRRWRRNLAGIAGTVVIAALVAGIFFLPGSPFSKDEGAGKAPERGDEGAGRLGGMQMPPVRQSGMPPHGMPPGGMGSGAMPGMMPPHGRSGAPVLPGNLGVPALLTRLAEAARLEAGAKEQGESGPVSAEERAGYMADIRALMMKHGREGTERIHEEIEKYLKAKGPRARAWFESGMSAGGPDPAAQARRALPEIVKALEAAGTLEAFAGLMAVYAGLEKTDANGAILEALGAMDPRSASANPPGREKTQKALEAMLETGRGVLPPARMQELEELLREARETLEKEDPAASPAKPAEKPDPERMKSVAEHLEAVRKALGIEDPLPAERSREALAGAALETRARLLRRIALDDGEPIGHRTAALEAMLRCAPGALSGGEVAQLAGDGSLAPEARLLAVRLAGAGKAGAAVNALVALLGEAPGENADSIPEVSLFSLKAEAAGALGAIGDSRAAPALIELLSRPMEAGANLKPWAAEALASIGSKEAIPAVEKALDSDATLGASGRRRMQASLERLRR